jgi:hypothetical protein
MAAACSRRHFLYALSAAAIGEFFRPRLIRADARPKPIFSDVTAEAGITWRQFNGFSPDRYLIETMGGGVGLFDFDDDGWLDIFLLNGGETPRGKSEKPLQNALYRNLGNGKFVDVAAEVGLNRVKHYQMGVAPADFDNDGHQDIFITGFPNCTLYHNNGNGTFTDITADAGLQNRDDGPPGLPGLITIAMDFSILSSVIMRSFRSRVSPRSASTSMFERTASSVCTKECL